MKAHRVLGGDGIELVHQGGAGTLQKSVVALLDAVDAGQHLNLRHAWHVWQAQFTFSSGLRTQWSDTFDAPSRMYGIWQSAQATPLRAWIPGFTARTRDAAPSGSAPLSACL